MARLFSAVDIQDRDLLRKLEEIQKTLNLGFKPVPKENMHITFQFFQNLNEEETQQVISALENVNASSFTSSVKGVDAFPSREYIRVVWAGLENEKFDRLYKQVCSHKVRSDNSHEFLPHITLLRVENIERSEKRKLQRMIRDYSNHYFGDLHVDNVKLFESSNGNYREVFSKEL